MSHVSCCYRDKVDAERGSVVDCVEETTPESPHSVKCTAGCSSNGANRYKGTVLQNKQIIDPTTKLLNSQNIWYSHCNHAEKILILTNRPVSLKIIILCNKNSTKDAPVECISGILSAKFFQNCTQSTNRRCFRALQGPFGKQLISPWKTLSCRINFRQLIRKV